MIDPDNRDRRDLALADLLLLAARVMSPAADQRREELALPQTDLDQLIAATGAVQPGPLAAAVWACLEAAHATNSEAWAREYTRLFDGAIACPLNEERRDGKNAPLRSMSGVGNASCVNPFRTGH